MSSSVHIIILSKGSNYKMMPYMLQYVSYVRTELNALIK